ncbi:DUF6882 domain-containing protein [Winogradskyella alexanderae]|uniref:Uncharacterized protein n=1 Tax=Winogradskyella alexanderae TaxID=2877123 RepID=A0ABS7XWT1_9FLAO|nr:DUF6882 domain-containing protein [Winogradskyella alexanderae]MCA0133919.1 hypothetical protein [Winogradskyella alexanderae]
MKRNILIMLSILGLIETKAQSPEDYRIIEKDKPTSLNQLLVQTGAYSFEKQLIFSDLIGENSWSFDTNKGEISFGENLVFPVQIIGTFSFSDNSWLWGWANTQSGLPDNLLQQSFKLKSLGENWNIPELTVKQINNAEGIDHKIGMISAGLFNAKCYYLANYGRGNLVVTIDSERIPIPSNTSAEKLISVFTQFISFTEVNHREALKNYLIDKKFEIVLGSNFIKAKSGENFITAKFDENGRLTEIKNK